MAATCTTATPTRGPRTSHRLRTPSLFTVGRGLPRSPQLTPRILQIIHSPSPPPVFYLRGRILTYTPTGFPGSNMDRQTPPSPANGTGMVGLPAAAINGMPMPAGHQADLNIVYSMVDELSRLLAENQAKTDYILESVGRVRQRAAAQGLSNEEIISQVANELNGM